MPRKIHVFADSILHPIARVCKNHNLTHEQFSEAVLRKSNRVRNISPAYISQIIRGKRYPSRSLAIAIVNAFPGEITIEGLMTFSRGKGKQEKQVFEPLYVGRRPEASL